MFYTMIAAFIVGMYLLFIGYSWISDKRPKIKEKPPTNIIVQNDVGQREMGMLCIIVGLICVGIVVRAFLIY